MTIHPGTAVARGIRLAFDSSALGSLSDAELLERFLEADANGEGCLAFELVVKRHGPMVLGVCRGVLGDHHEAEDAFQATFLVLIRQARSIRQRDSLASWLHGVALRVSRRLGSARTRRERLLREQANRPRSAPSPSPSNPPVENLHALVGQLPDRFREPLILCHLEGHPLEEVARRLKIPLGTVKSRLARARERLRRRLDASRLEALLGGVAVPPRLARVTTGLLDGVRPAARNSTINATLMELAEGVVTTMTWNRWMLTLAKVAAVASVGGVVLATGIAGGQEAPRTPGVPPKARLAPGTGAAPAKLVPRDLRRPQPPRRVDEAPDPLGVVAPRSVTALAGRGTVLIYQLNEKGDRVVAPRLPPGQSGGKEGPFLETTRELRWVAVTAVLDHRAARDAGARARGLAVSESHPAYRRADVERQSRVGDEAWSDWAKLDMNRNYEVLDNLPEYALDRTPEAFRPMALADQLPFLKQGTWEGVDVEEVIRQPVPTSAGRPKPRFGDPETFDADLLLIRSLDFTVEPGTTYRYRTRIVLKNADENGPRSLSWPWSAPSPEVTVPAN